MGRMAHATEIPWQQPACLLCGSAAAALLVEAPDRLNLAGPRYRVVRCAACGLCFTSPRPDPAGSVRFYPADYAPHQPGRLRPRPVRWWKRPRAAGRRNFESEGILPFGQRRLLDVGCGGGSFLHRMQALGWNVTGLDVSAAAVQRIRTQLGLRAVVGTLPHAELTGGRFEAVTLWQSLEHFHQPLAALRQVHELLAPGGRVYLSVPNIDSGPFRWFGAAWLGLDLPRHLVHFTPATLRRMLDAAGFADVRLWTLPQSDWLRQTAELARQQGAARGWQRLLCNRRLARLASRWFHWTGSSDCLAASAARGPAGDRAADAQGS